MEFPRGHDPHHHHRPNREEEVYPPPGRQHPPPYYDPPPPQVGVAHVSHISGTPSYGETGPYPPPPHGGFDYRQDPPPPHGGFDYRQDPPPPHGGFDYRQDRPPPPPVAGGAHVEHVSHQSHHPHFPSFIHHHSQQPHHSEITNKPSVRVYCKAESNFSLSIRDGKVILARADSSDPFQHWVKDEKYSTKVKDEEGFPSFALVNKVTGQALKHSIGATKPVQLIPYNPDHLDESILWTLSHETGEGFRTIRMVNNIKLNVDAFNGDKQHGGVHDGTTIVLWEWKKGENQRWKIVPYYE